MSSILEELEREIAGLKTSTTKSNVGVVREAGDGVARVEGLSEVMLNEMIEFPGGEVGLALNLEETEVGVILLGDATKVSEGDEVKTTGKLLQVPVGKALLGRVVNTLGQPVDNKGPIKTDTYYPVEKIAPGIIKRRSVNQPVQTGIMAIDAMVPIGRGQRELIIGDRATGKSTIAVDTIIAQARLNKAAEEGRLKDHRPLLHLRRDRAEEFQRGPHPRGAREAGRDALHHDRFRARFRERHEPVSRALCRRGDG